MSDRSHRVADEAFLRSIAELDRFWIHRQKGIRKGGLIHFLGSTGKAMVLMDDDDNRVERCIRLLESSGCPVFDDTSKMDAYAQELSRNTKR